METYKIKTVCFNCKTRFLAENEEEAFYCYAISPEVMIEIPKGTRVCDVECPVCGCKTLIAKP